uniref:Uncharacterized protein n=1 Tax=Anopheles dirus TaxID=7168 RepID=A0A182N9K4_9DIPT
MQRIVIKRVSNKKKPSDTKFIRLSAGSLPTPQPTKHFDNFDTLGGP